MRKLSLIVMFCHLLSCPAFAQSPSKGYKAGLSAVIYRIHSAREWILPHPMARRSMLQEAGKSLKPGIAAVTAGTSKSGTRAAFPRCMHT